MKRSLLWISVAGCLLALAGCTRMVMSVAGIDPDTVKITAVRCYGVREYQPVIDNIKPLKGEFREEITYIVPTERQISEYINNSPYVEKLALLYQKEVYDSLGSMRTIEEMRSRIIPGLTCTNKFVLMEFMHRILRKRGIFGYVKLDRSGDFRKIDGSIFKNFMYIDFEDVARPKIVLVRSGEKVSSNLEDMFSDGDVDGFDFYLEWVEKFYT